MDRMSALAQSRFEALLCEHLSGSFVAAANAPAPTLLQAVGAGVEMAQGYGIDLQNDLRRFIEFLFSHGARFADQPGFEAVVATLRRDDLDGTQKMTLLDMQEPSLPRQAA